ncbi:hypothetical protein RAD16_04955 [Bradyrhizobium sp. 18BD]
MDRLSREGPAGTTDMDVEKGGYILHQWMKPAGPRWRIFCFASRYWIGSSRSLLNVQPTDDVPDGDAMPWYWRRAVTDDELSLYRAPLAHDQAIHFANHQQFVGRQLRKIHIALNVQATVLAVTPQLSEPACVACC